MNVKEIHIVNFRNFYGHHALKLCPEVNAIIGCNGVGKSGVLNALSFVYGESMCHRDDRKISKLINEQKRREQTGLFCIVVAFVSDGSTIYRIGRRIFANNTQKFYVNDQRFNNVSDYHRALQDLNITALLRGINIIPQNATMYLCSLSPGELMKHFEEYCGSNELGIKMRECKASMKTLSSHVRESAKTFKEQKQKLMKFQAKLFSEELNSSKLRQLQTLEKAALFTNIWVTSRQIGYLKDTYRTLTPDNQTFVNKQKTHRLLSYLSKEIFRRAELMNLYRKDTLISIRRKLKELERDRDSAAERLVKLRKVQERAENNLLQIGNSLSQKQEVHAALSVELTALEDRISEIEQRSDQRLELDDDVKTKIVECDNQFLLEHQDVTKTIENLKASLEGSNEQLMQCFIRNKESDLRVLEEDLENAKRNLTIMEAAHRELVENKVPPLELQKQQLEADILELKKETITQRNDIIEMSLQDSEEKTASRRSSRLKLNEVLYLLKANINTHGKREILGSLSDLVKSENAENFLAFKRILGSRSNSIVVSSRKILAESLGCLEEYNIPALTFLTLTNEDQAHSDDVIAAAEAFRIERFSEICEPIDTTTRGIQHKIRKLIVSLTSNVCFCESLEKAQEVSDRYPKLCIVVRDGTLVRRRGFLTFGANEDHIPRQKPSIRDLKTIEARDKIRIDIRKLEVLEADLSKVRSQLKILQNERQILQRNISIVEDELETLRRKSDPIKETLLNAQKELAGMASADMRSKELRELQRKFTESRVENLRKKFRRRKLPMKLVLVYMGIEAEESDNDDNEENELETLKEQRKILSNRIRVIEADMRLVEKNKKKVQAASDSHKKDIVAFENDVLLVTRIEETLTRQEEAKCEWMRRYNYLELMKTQYSTILTYCEGNFMWPLINTKSRSEIRSELPALRQTLKRLEADYRKHRLMMQEITDQEGDPIETVLDYSLFPRWLLTPDKMEIIKIELERQIRDIIDSHPDVIKLHQPPRLNPEEVEAAIRDVNNVQFSMVETRTQIDGLLAQWNEAKDERNNTLKNFVQKLREALPSTFSCLYGKPNGTDGTRMDLIVSADENDDYYNGAVSIDCFPPNCTYKPFAKLSGGQKSMASLALHFSIQQVNEAPLLAVDEVDRLLTNEYCRRYGMNLREFGSAVRQVIFVTHRGTTLISALPDCVIGIAREHTLKEVLTYRIQREPDGSFVFKDFAICEDQLPEGIVSEVSEYVPGERPKEPKIKRRRIVLASPDA